MLFARVRLREPLRYPPGELKIIREHSKNREFSMKAGGYNPWPDPEESSLSSRVSPAEEFRRRQYSIWRIRPRPRGGLPAPGGTGRAAPPEGLRRAAVSRAAPRHARSQERARRGCLARRRCNRQLAGPVSGRSPSRPRRRRAGHHQDRRPAGLRLRGSGDRGDRRCVPRGRGGGGAASCGRACVSQSPGRGLGSSPGLALRGRCRGDSWRAGRRPGAAWIQVGVCDRRGPRSADRLQRLRGFPLALQ